MAYTTQEQWDSAIASLKGLIPEIEKMVPAYLGTLAYPVGNEGNADLAITPTVDQQAAIVTHFETRVNFGITLLTDGIAP